MERAFEVYKWCTSLIAYYITYVPFSIENLMIRHWNYTSWTSSRLLLGCDDVKDHHWTFRFLLTTGYRDPAFRIYEQAKIEHKGQLIIKGSIQKSTLSGTFSFLASSRSHKIQPAQAQIREETSTLNYLRTPQIGKVAIVIPVLSRVILLHDQIDVGAQQTAASRTILAGRDGYTASIRWMQIYV